MTRIITGNLTSITGDDMAGAKVNVRSAEGTGVGDLVGVDRGGHLSGLM